MFVTSSVGRDVIDPEKKIPVKISLTKKKRGGSRGYRCWVRRIKRLRLTMKNTYIAYFKFVRRA